MLIWIIVLTGLFLAALFWAEIYFGRLNRQQMLAGARTVITMLGILLLYWAGLPWLEKKLQHAGLSSGAAAVVVIAILVFIAVLGRRSRKKKEAEETQR